MKSSSLLVAGVAAFFGLSHLLADTPKIAPADAAAKVAAGEAILVDVREPAEWKEGVAAPAVLLPLSDLRGDRTQWKAFLEKAGDKPIVLYCRSGNRSGQAAEILAKEGKNVANAGGYKDWVAAGLPTKKPE
jgi:rhodanese-related sulfurtransferase